ncbi:MAG: periplasmic heavy metal sensor [Desulfobacula sp.]|uniref:periplasmic heavy metal sensor n=1 Tax=Desulfobacula sp. TaxID=2593537 RepID=UPI0025C3D9E4|nr:periplasmic heavy metal sensor [Desulfobacula sp.]MCD4722627.1 periplasmic heavy metal sensor [Desulfobacula sp.]
MSTKIRICIISSLMVNLLLLGIVGGHLLRFAGKEKVLPPRISYMLNNLSPEKSSMMDRMLIELNEQNKTILSDIKQHRQDIYNILTSNNFDINSYRRSSTKMNKSQSQLLGNIGEKIESVASRLTQDERIILAELLKEPPAIQNLQHSDM